MRLECKIEGRVPAFGQASLPQRFVQVAQMCIGPAAGRAIRTERHHTGREALVSIHYIVPAGDKTRQLGGFRTVRWPRHVAVQLGALPQTLVPAMGVLRHIAAAEGRFSPGERGHGRFTERAYGDVHSCCAQPPIGRKVWVMGGRSCQAWVIRHGSSGGRGLTARHPLCGDIILCRRDACSAVATASPCFKSGM